MNTFSINKKNASVIDFLNQAVELFPDKVAFIDANRSLNYSELVSEAKHLATEVIKYRIMRQPVAVYLEKSVECAAAYYGILYSGNFYSPLDTEMPIARIDKIMETLRPRIIITDQAHYESVQTFSRDAVVLVYETIQNNTIDSTAIEYVRAQVTDNDPMYVLFTSGSTGTPKGVVISHRALTDFVIWASEKWQFNSETVFGNQTPFYFSMSIWDLFITVYCGGTCHIIPHELFMFPADLMRYIASKGITSLVWVPSALTLVVKLKGLTKVHADKLQDVFFGGEVMPVKYLNRWIAEYPDVRFVNIYGPTEVTDTFTAYTVEREFSDAEALPIGEPRTNHEILIIDENDKKIDINGVGELCVRGAGLATGYYNNPQQTSLAFVQNPLNTAYPDLIYRTGDLVKYNEHGELIYVARKDYQIKHMGHRIELGEIETVLVALEGVESGCCLYDSEKLRIIALFVGEIDDDTLIHSLKRSLPDYMFPSVRIRLEEMPFNLNGKIDRAKLKDMIKEYDKNE